MERTVESVYFNDPDIRDALLVFDSYTKEEFLASVAYVSDGKIVDTMFDAFFFTKVDHFMPARIESWQEYIDAEFAVGRSMDALDAAVGEVKAALGLPDYRVTVFMTAFPPHKQTGIIEANGLRFDLSDLEDKKKATRWQADEQIRRFREKNYQNLKIGGFHWPVESAPPTDPDMYYLGWDFTDYVRSFGWKTNWGPYFLASGHNCHKDLGFDLAVVQPNYFSGNSPNGGGIERLRSAAQIMKDCDMGFSPELESDRREAVRVFKDYLRCGVEFGYMYAYHVWYMVCGPHMVNFLHDSEDPFIRATYDEVYHFIKKDLDTAKMILE